MQHAGQGRRAHSSLGSRMMQCAPERSRGERMGPSQDYQGWLALASPARVYLNMDLKRARGIWRRRWFWAAAAMVIVMSVLVTFTQVACSVVGIRLWEEHAHTELVREGRFSVRQYEQAVFAVTEVRPGEGDPDEVMFARLGGYISGKNDAGKKISMTMPVIQEEAGKKIAMTMPVVQEQSPEGIVYSFVMPAEYTMDALPRPSDPSVRLEERPGGLMGVYRFSGIARADDSPKHSPTLLKWLESKGYRATGPARLAYYDPPWTIPFLRRNEVQVPIEQSP